MKIAIDIDNACNCLSAPATEQWEAWARCCLEILNRESNYELSVRLLDEAAMAELNKQYRNKDTATNVLSFPSQLPSALIDSLDTHHLGDIVICPLVLEREAQTQNKALQAHWAHLIVHGLLHLLGYDHAEASAANTMERLEIQTLKKLGFPDPYLIG